MSSKPTTETSPGTREAGVFEGADGADGGDVVEAEDGGEVAGLFEQGLHGFVADFGRHGVVAVLHRPAGGVDADDERWSRA